MAEYSSLTDEQLLASHQELVGLLNRYPDTARRKLDAVRLEAERRQRASRLAGQESFERDVAERASAYGQLPARLEAEVAGWRPPPHPRPEEAFDAEESPQLASRFSLRPWNKPLVKTGRMWERDNRAAELARRLQAERRAAEQDGPAALAAFDKALPLVAHVDTNVTDTWSPGLEPWGLIGRGLSLPSAFGSMFAGLGEQASGRALAAAGVPNKASDEMADIEWRTSRTADDLLGNIPTGLYYMATGDKRYAPGYAKAYWDEVSRRESAPLSVMRPGASLPDTSSSSYDTGSRAMEYTDDMTKGLGLSDNARLAAGMGSMMLAGAATDVFQPSYAGGLLRRAGAFGKDMSYGAGIQGGIIGAQIAGRDTRQEDQAALDAYYDNLLRSLQSQNRITE